MRQVPTTGSPFCIDETEVTRFQYLQFVNSNKPSQSGACSSNSSFTPLAGWPAGAGENAYPVVGIDWCDAKAYCEWAGKRLCGKIGGGALTNDGGADPDGEWYWACSKGGTQDYPYGATYDALRCNGSGYGQGKAIAVGLASNCIGGYSNIWDMSGNVREWIDACNDIQDQCATRGGAYDSAEPTLKCSSGALHGRLTWSASIGFRCCKD
jgi:formylglycine-generating enzyme required for sulfatase activity